MVRKVFLMTIVLFCCAVPALAQQLNTAGWNRQNHWDFSLQTRYTTSKDYAGEGGSTLNLEDDLGWGFGLSYNFNDRFNLGIDFSWRSINYDARALAGDGSGDFEEYGGNLDVSSIGLEANWYVLDGRYTPYVTGSIGWTMIDSNIFAGWDSGCWWDPWWGYICGTVPMSYGTDTGAYNLGVGGRFELTRAFFVRVGWEYNWLGDGPVDGGNMLRIDLGLMN